MASQLETFYWKEENLKWLSFIKNYPDCFDEAMQMALSKEEPFC